VPSFETIRETTIDAAPEVIHGLINDFHNWVQWSPWEELDPEMKRTFSGADTGAGAQYAWVGNKKVGTGNMEIISSTPEEIALNLEFIAPIKASNKTVFALQGILGGTKVSWTMSGERGAVHAVMGKLFFDKMIAKDFDKGLAKLKAAAEG